MLKVTSTSKLGRQMVARNGDLWVPVKHDPQCLTLGGRQGIQLKSVKTGKTFWFEANGRDPNLMVIDRVNEKGESLLPKIEKSPIAKKVIHDAASDVQGQPDGVGAHGGDAWGRSNSALLPAAV